MSKDPAKADGEESAYQYCGGDPVGKVDPSGERPIITWRWRFSRDFSGLNPLFMFGIGQAAREVASVARGVSRAARLALEKATGKAMKSALKRAQGMKYTASETTRGYAVYIVHGLYTRKGVVPGREDIMYWAKQFRTPIGPTDRRGRPTTYKVYFSFTVCVGQDNFSKR